MKFIGEPNLLVKFNKPIDLFKYIQFNTEGVFQTHDEKLINKLKLHFKSKGSTNICKYCEETFESTGKLLVHYRKHKEVAL